MKTFNGKAIYNPAGKAGEYAKWACNFYVGCSNMCDYCYCKKGILNNVMGMDEPQLKKILDERNRLVSAINACNAEIDLVFSEVQSNNYELYSKMFINGSNKAVARFEMDGELIEIERNLGYSNPFERISIDRKTLIQ